MIFKITKTFFILFLSLLFIFFVNVQADFRDTPAGEPISATNTLIHYSNIVNWEYVITNDYTNASSLAAIVEAIFGFTNYGSMYVNITNTNYPSQPRYYYFAFTNEGNSNSVFDFSYSYQWITNYDGIYPTNVSGWQISLLSSTNPDSLWTNLGNPYTAISTNMSEDTGISFFLKITNPRNAVNGTGVDLYFTNNISPLTADGPYTGTNTYVYGGTNFYQDKITFRIVAPDVKVWKTMTITNISGPKAGSTTEVVPGSIITYTVNYTNKGGMTALGCYFDDDLPHNLTGARTNYVGFLSNSIICTPAVNVTGTNFITNSVAGSYVPAAIADDVIDGIRLGFGDLSIGTGGTIEYKVVVK